MTCHIPVRLSPACGVMASGEQELSGDENPELPWEMCTRVLLGDTKSEPAKRSRRLYDVANVLLAIKLIAKGPSHSHRMPTYQWLGVKSVGTYFNRVASGACASPQPAAASRLRKSPVRSTQLQRWLGWWMCGGVRGVAKDGFLARLALPHITLLPHARSTLSQP